MRLVNRPVPSIALVAIGLWFGVATGAPADSRAPEPAGTVRDLIDTTSEYRQALERVLVFRARDVDRAAARVEQRRELYARGIVSRREMEAAERGLEEARAKMEETQQQIAQADHALAEALAAVAPPAPAEPESRPSPEPGVPAVVVRYRGAGAWSLADAPRLDRFFRERFGRALPVSAYGQTPVHDRLRLDHHQALDVAVHPDSQEGLALLAFLRGAGISFIAFREAMPGAATGAHIHVGAPSPRTAALPPAPTPRRP